MQSTLFSVPSSSSTLTISISGSRLLNSISYPRNYSLSCSSKHNSESFPSTNNSSNVKDGLFKELEMVGDQENCPRPKPMPTKDMTALQRHVSFFDRNHDGYVFPCETYQGLKAIGVNEFLSILAAIFINVTFSGSSRPGKFPDPLFPIAVEHIAKAEHGSHTGIYDHDGTLNEKRLDEIFDKYANSQEDALTVVELVLMVLGNMKFLDFQGGTVAIAEWGLLYMIFKDGNGLLTKDTVRALYDGSLFEAKKKEILTKKWEMKNKKN